MIYRVDASPETIVWGHFDAAHEPVLTVSSGDTVIIGTESGTPEVIPTSGFEVPPALAEIHKRCQPLLGVHILTGPIAVKGAIPGRVLEVRIENIELTQDWGYNIIRPLTGTLPYEFETRILHIPLDRQAGVGHLPWGLDLPLSPFFGIMGVAPPAKWGPITSIVPRAHGGNIDNKELVAGTTLYLPIFNEGALFYCGDGHGAQGDGEVCVTAIETGLRGTFRFFVRDDLSFTYPQAETPTHFMTMGMDADLDQCAVMALRDMLALIKERTGLSREDAYTLCSLAGDLRITQTVNGSKGVHMMLAKSLL